MSPASLCCAALATVWIVGAASLSSSGSTLQFISLGTSFLVLTVCGAFICRRTALQIADLPEPVSRTLGFLKKRIIGVCVAPLLPLTLVGLVRAFGWLCSGYIEMACIGFSTIAFIVVALAYPLMLAGQCVEGTDCFDGLSRGLNFVLTAPIRYVTKLIAVAAICLVPVLLVRWSLVHIETPSGIVKLFLFPLQTSALAAFFSWATVTFVHLREAIDATEINEVYVPNHVALEPIPLSGKVAHPVQDAA